MANDAIKLLQQALQAAKQATPVTPVTPVVRLSEEEINLQLQTKELSEVSSRKSNSEEVEETDETILTGNIKTSLQSIVNNFSDKELVSKDVRYVLSTLQKHPTLKQILQPEDVGIMVKGLQICYSSQIKRAETTASKNVKKKQDVAEIGSMLDGLGIE